ncbi:unnamed protein product, partial [Mesorhabditis belari]|uniref:Delta(24)-sterol reductase n=1 Tax=Mesorhabditis belari TaxID=2138241 RepID=A0AAF3EW54_9BILA
MSGQTFREDLKEKAIRWLEENRGIVILFFVLPASLIFDLFVRVRIWVNRKFLEKSSTHENRVETIQQRVKVWNSTPSSDRKLLCTSRPNWQSLSTTFFDKTKCHQIPVDLHEILALDEKNLILHAEPNVTVAEACKYLVPKGYALAVTLEIGDATLGGLAFGVGMTTHSHKVGLYQETIVEYEVVTSKGDLLIVTGENEHSDLFYCLPWSHGTLGFLTSLKLKLIKVKPYVHMTYLPMRQEETLCRQMMKLSGAIDKDYQVADFLEATIYDKDKAVIMVANFAEVDTLKKWWKINDVTRWWKPWFYKYVETKFIGGGSEYIPLESYLLRHNRAIFWVVEDMIPFGNHWLFRLLFGWLLPPKPAFLKFTTTSAVREMTFAKQVFQDIVMPLETLDSQMAKAVELFERYPLLVYPCRIYDHQRGPQGQLRVPPKERLVPGTNYAMYNDLGVYGTPGQIKAKKFYNPSYAMREMEKFTREVGGYSFLYADIFMDEKEFNEMFDMELYEKVRKRYNCNEAFPRLYDKVKPEVDVIQISEEFAKKQK